MSHRTRAAISLALACGLLTRCVGLKEGNSLPDGGGSNDASVEATLTDGAHDAEAGDASTADTWTAEASTADAPADAAPDSSVDARSWHRLNGSCAASISGSDGRVPWAIGCTNGDGTGNLPILWLNSYDLASGTNSWSQVNTFATSVSAAYQPNQPAPDLYVWVVRQDGSLSMGLSEDANTVSFSQVMPAGSARSVTCDPFQPSHVAYVTTATSQGSNGYGFAKLDTNASPVVSPWPGAGAYITVGTDGTPWSLGATNGVFEWNAGSSSWLGIIPETATKPTLWTLSGGWAASAYAIVPSGNILYWTGSIWTDAHFPFAGNPAVQVSVGTNGTVWAVASDGAVWTYQ
jgi:hypothetical protein